MRARCPRRTAWTTYLFESPERLHRWQDDRLRLKYLMLPLDRDA